MHRRGRFSGFALIGCRAMLGVAFAGLAAAKFASGLPGRAAELGVLHGVVGAPTVYYGVAVVEGITAMGFVVAPRPAFKLSLAICGVFATVLILEVVLNERLDRCGCFGSIRSTWVMRVAVVAVLSAVCMIGDRVHCSSTLVDEHESAGR